MTTAALLDLERPAVASSSSRPFAPARCSTRRDTSLSSQLSLSTSAALRSGNTHPRFRDRQLRLHRASHCSSPQVTSGATTTRSTESLRATVFTHDYACNSPLTLSDPSGESLGKRIGGKLLDSYRKGRLVIDEIIDCEELAELIGAMRWSLSDRQNDFTSNIHGWTFSDKEFKNHVRRFTDERALLEALLARYDELDCDELSAEEFVQIEKVLSKDPTELLGHPGRPGQSGWAKAADIARGAIEVGALVSAGIGAMVLAG